MQRQRTLTDLTAGVAEQLLTEAVRHAADLDRVDDGLFLDPSACSSTWRPHSQAGSAAAPHP